MSKLALYQFTEFASRKLNEIQNQLAPGAKITLMCRFPDKPEQDILMTADTFNGMRELIERRERAATVQGKVESPA